MLTLTQVQDKLGLKLGGDFIRDELKIEPTETNKRAMFYDESKFTLICEALIVYVAAVKAGTKVAVVKTPKAPKAPSLDDLF